MINIIILEFNMIIKKYMIILLSSNDYYNFDNISNIMDLFYAVS